MGQLLLGLVQIEAVAVRNRARGGYKLGLALVKDQGRLDAQLGPHVRPRQGLRLMEQLDAVRPVLAASVQLLCACRAASVHQATDLLDIESRSLELVAVGVVRNDPSAHALVEHRLLAGDLPLQAVNHALEPVNDAVLLLDGLLADP